MGLLPASTFWCNSEAETSIVCWKLWSVLHLNLKKKGWREGVIHVTAVVCECLQKMDMISMCLQP